MVAFLEKLFLGLCTIIVLFIILLVSLQNQSVFKHALVLFAKLSLPDYSIEHVTFRDHSIEFFKSVNVSELHLRIKDNDNNEWNISFKEFKIRCDNLLMVDDKHFEIDFYDTHIQKAGHFNLKDVSANVKFDAKLDAMSRDIFNLEGVLNIGQLTNGYLTVYDLRMSLTNEQKNIIFKDIWGKFLDGTLRGDVVTTYNGGQWLYTMGGKFTNINTRKIDQFDFVLKGIFGGEINLRGGIGRKNRVKGHFFSSKEVQVTVGFFKDIVKDLPKQTIVNLFEKMFQSTDDVILNDMNVEFVSSDNGDLNIKSNLVNLRYDFNVKRDFSIDGGTELVNLIKFFTQGVVGR